MHWPAQDGALRAGSLFDTASAWQATAAIDSLPGFLHPDNCEPLCLTLSLSQESSEEHQGHNARSTLLQGAEGISDSRQVMPLEEDLVGAELISGLRLLTATADYWGGRTAPYQPRGWCVEPHRRTTFLSRLKTDRQRTC